MNYWFFDRYGSAVFLLNTDGRFFDRNGRNLGYIYQREKLYNYYGKHCGWIKGGVVRDLRGLTVAFSYGASDYPSPIFPIPQIPPIPAIPQIPPIPAIPQIPHLEPIKGFGWSPLSAFELFE